MKNEIKKGESWRLGYMAGCREKFGSTRNSKVLLDFVEFCESNPELRFWQALFAWVGVPGRGGILVGGEDPFYWEDKMK